LNGSGIETILPETTFAVFPGPEYGFFSYVAMVTSKRQSLEAPFWHQKGASKLCFSKT
jgi:hypothetical protein